MTVSGMITLGEDSHFYLEDTTMKIKLDLCQAESDGKSYFVPGNIVICLGMLVGTKF